MEHEATEKVGRGEDRRGPEGRPGGLGGVLQEGLAVGVRRGPQADPGASR